MHGWTSRLARAGALASAALALAAGPLAADQSGGGPDPFAELRERAPAPPPAPPKPAFRVPAGVETAPVRLAKASARLRAGQQIGRFPRGFLDGCLWTDLKVDWPGGRGVPLLADLEQVFAEAFEAAGYAAVSTAYGFAEPEPRVDYDVAAVIADLDLDLCAFIGVMGFEPPDRFKGSGRTTIEWELRDRLTRQVVLRLRTTGHGRVERPTSEIIIALVERTFADAAARLAAQPEVLELLRRDAAPATVRRDPSAQPTMQVVGPAPYTRAGAARMAHAQDATVLVLTGSGHGSGFFISEDGYLLSNLHVVGQQREIRVRMNNGVELIGEVVRSDRRRDVALIKLPVGRVPALPVRTGLPPVGSDVFAIGAPRYEDLQGTVSRGVVSAHRPASERLPAMIQSDATIHGGNSGGPLVDAKGNVVGITVASAADRGGALAGLNLFIPVAEALAALRIELAAGS